MGSSVCISRLGVVGRNDINPLNLPSSDDNANGKRSAIDGKQSVTATDSSNPISNNMGRQRMQPFRGDPDFLRMHSAIWQPDLT